MGCQRRRTQRRDATLPPTAMTTAVIAITMYNISLVAVRGVLSTASRLRRTNTAPTTQLATTRAQPISTRRDLLMRQFWQGPRLSVPV